MADVIQQNDAISVSSTSSDEDEEGAVVTATAAAAMPTPIRQETTPGRPSRSPGRHTRIRVSLSPGSTATRLSSELKFTGKVCKIYDAIKEDGWEYRNGKLSDWTFVPPVIAKLIQDKTITFSQLLKDGIDGIHYADGWLKLGEMLLTYGVKHAPSGLYDIPPPHPLLEGYTIDRLYDELIVETPQTGSSASAKKPAAASTSTTKESAGVGDSFTPVASEANKSNNKRKQDKSLSTSSGKTKKGKKSSTKATTAATRVSPREGDLVNAAKFFEEAQNRYFGYAALESAKKELVEKTDELMQETSNS